MTRASRSASLLHRPLRELLARLPAAELHRVGLGACLGCAMAPFETVAEAARMLGLDTGRVVSALESKGRA